MSSNAGLDVSSWTAASVQDAWAVADCLRGIHSAMVKWKHKDCEVFPQINIQRIQIWRAWRPGSGSSSTYPSATIRVIGTSRTARLKWPGVPCGCTTFVLWLPVVHLIVTSAVHVSGNLSSGCLQADEAKHVGLPKSHQHWTGHQKKLSAITHKLNVSGHMLIWTLFSCFSYLELVPTVCPHLSVSPCITYWSSHIHINTLSITTEWTSYMETKCCSLIRDLLHNIT
jgi:hypothetical protein